ncbi:hypothetical protein [Allokutzneria sp. NRRL B-24872]|uniref:hypothetical protein n=1 Tax=Allokutzneria sp. NRRL B-24872 TaxID=1137961 RepID=UPI000A36E21D|nr:hypothetical protein [Allokutzneria sp. NRRL B-24872]
MRVMTRCTIKDGQLDQVVELLRAVYAELESVRPDGLRYASFQLDDGASLMSLVELDGGPEVLHRLPAFQRYRTHLTEACAEPPVTTVLNEIGAYGFPDGANSSL